MVDDLNSNREVLVDFLTPLGFDVIEAKSGEGAIAIIQQHQPDLVLLDLVMPEMNGCEVTRCLRKSGLVDLPVIIVSATSTVRDKLECDRAGASGFLTKPIHFEQLLRIIEQHLDLTWITDSGTKQLGSNVSTPHQKLEETSVITPSTEELMQLLELITLGDIRGTISHATSLAREQPELELFTRQITQLAENCQLKKLKQLIQQYIDA